MTCCIKCLKMSSHFYVMASITRMGTISLVRGREGSTGCRNHLKLHWSKSLQTQGIFGTWVCTETLLRRTLTVSGSLLWFRAILVKHTARSSAVMSQSRLFLDGYTTEREQDTMREALTTLATWGTSVKKSRFWSLRISSCSLTCRSQGRSLSSGSRKESRKMLRWQGLRKSQKKRLISIFRILWTHTSAFFVLIYSSSRRREKRFWVMNMWGSFMRLISKTRLSINNLTSTSTRQVRIGTPLKFLSPKQRRMC